LQQAFSGTVILSTSSSQRGTFNRAIKHFVFAGLQPDDLPARKSGV